jgi:isopenicillin N synthase-like dioxygenase
MGYNGQASFQRPAIVDQYMDTLRQFVRFINTATAAIMYSLSKPLGLVESENFMTYHRLTAPSPDIVRLLRYHAQPMRERGIPQAPHTDLGSLTFLFTRQPGLQTLSPESGEWTWVQPKAGCVIVNLGNGMRLLTNGFFRSCLHQVGPLPSQAMPERFSFAYLVRAEDETPMTGLKSALILEKKEDEALFTSREWLEKKFGVLRLDARPKYQEWVLTGQQNELPV